MRKIIDLFGNTRTVKQCAWCGDEYEILQKISCMLCKEKQNTKYAPKHEMCNECLKKGCPIKNSKYATRRI